MIKAQITADRVTNSVTSHTWNLHVHFQAPFLKQPQIQIQQNLNLRYPHILRSFLLSQKMSCYQTLQNYYIGQCWWIMWTLWTIFDVWFKHFTATCYHHQDSIFIWNVDALLLTYTTSHIRKQWLFFLLPL